MVSSASQSPVRTSIGPPVDHLLRGRQPVAEEPAAVGDPDRLAHARHRLVRVRRLVELDDQGVRVDRLADLDEHPGDDAVHVGEDAVLHLHRLEQDEHLPRRHRLADLDVHGSDRARHRRDRTVADRVGRVVGEARGRWSTRSRRLRRRRTPRLRTAVTRHLADTPVDRRDHGHALARRRRRPVRSGPTATSSTSSVPRRTSPTVGSGPETLRQPIGTRSSGRSSSSTAAAALTACRSTIGAGPAAGRGPRGARRGTPWSSRPRGTRASGAWRRGSRGS